ncbi:MAG: alpha/beta fold hydrolase [Proteobacteria bacterium]|nr:alpha/beta fold hydrolase [Pseudomonadota bacterium]
MRSPRSIVSLVALALLLLVHLRLGALERGGPVHAELELDGGVPATLTLPGESSGGRTLGEPPPREERAPAVVLVHGFSSDRAGLSVLARSLAVAGYAVLSIDVRGHGSNRNSFTAARGRSDFLLGDVAAAVDHLRVSPWVDGQRIAVVGHSMGASAALAYGERDPGVDALVMISGGWSLSGTHRPANALFLYASGDPERIRTRAAELTARLAGVEHATPGEIYGEIEHDTAVRHVEISGADHVSIVSNSDAIAEIADWLDRSFDIQREGRAGRSDPRGAVVLLGFALLLFVLPGLGDVAGRLAASAEARPERSRAGGGAGLLLVAGGLVATLPIFAAGNPGALIPFEVGDITIPHFAVTGVMLLTLLALGGRLDRSSLSDVGAGAVAAGVVLFALYFLMTPLGVVVHRLSLTPERAAGGLLLMVLLVPFALAFNLLLRRGSTLESVLLCLGGRAIVVVATLIGIAMGVIPSVVSLMLPFLSFVFVQIEILCGSIYATSRSLIPCVIVEAGWLAWIFAAVLPVRI